ncbi:MAG: DUF4915 domain-containing protein [Planctomycetes bacterium]|nr:DUF4915 domain-containing protein [Planctomycetota bacterium]
MKIDERAWKTWGEFNRTIDKKRIIFFGYSLDWIGKTLRKSNLTISSIVDNSQNFQGTDSVYGVKILATKNLLHKRDDEYIVITSLSFESIYRELIHTGFTPGKDFCITPALNSVKVVNDINSKDFRLLVSSPDHLIYFKDTSNLGGGLYEFSVTSKAVGCEKLVAGTFRQIVDMENGNIAVLEEMNGIRIFEKGSVIGFWKFIECDKGDRPHGLAYDKVNNIFYMACTAKDEIAAYDADTGKPIDSAEILSWKASVDGKNHHWINDLAIKDRYLYLSLFSISGCQQEGVYDGGIMQINLDRPDERQVVARDLWMPHTVRFFGEELCYLDSMNGRFYKGSALVGEFNGFTRGLGYDGVYYYVGQSENRYFDQFKGKRNNVGMNAGFFLFDEETKASKFFEVPRLHQVHDLLVL